MRLTVVAGILGKAQHMPDARRHIYDLPRQAAKQDVINRTESTLRALIPGRGNEVTEAIAKTLDDAAVELARLDSGSPLG